MSKWDLSLVIRRGNYRDDKSLLTRGRLRNFFKLGIELASKFSNITIRKVRRQITDSEKSWGSIKWVIFWVRGKSIGTRINLEVIISIDYKLFQIKFHI